MATTRIKDLSKTATTVASDANIVIDGSSNGTQKITRDNFRQDTADAYVAAPSTYKLAPLNGVNKIDAAYLPTSGDTPKGEWNASTNSPTLADGTGTAGDYYDVTTAGTANLGSGAITYTVGDVVKYNGATWFKIDSVANILDGISTVDPAKTTLQIPNVGTAANEVSVNGMLGTMAFQSSAGVVVDDLTVDGQLTAAVGKPMPVNGPTMRFDGSNDFVSFAAPVGSAFSFTNSTDDTPFSVSAWVKLEDATSGTIISKFGSSASDREYRLYIDGSDLLTFDIRNTSGDSTRVYATTAMTGLESQWIHIAATYAGSGPNSATAFASAADVMSLYINGKSVALTKTNNSSYDGMSSTNGAAVIGRRFGADYFEGEIRDVKLSNKELSAAEVREVYSNGQLPESFAESTGGADVVTDGGFEDWTTSTDLTYWSERSNVSVAQESTDKLSGSYSCKLTGGGDIGSSGNNWLRQSGVLFNANKKYRLSGKVKRFSGSTNTLQFGASYYKIIQFNGTTFFPASSSTELPFVGAVTSKSLGNGWYSFSIEFTTTVANTFNLGVNGSTDPYLIDDVSLVQIGSVLDARAENYNQSAGKLLDVSGNDYVGNQSGGVELLTPRSHLSAGTLDLTNLPTSASGLSAGEVYNSSGTLKIV